MENEVWKDVGGFEGAYQVSNLGRVRSLTRVITSKYKKSNRTRVTIGRTLKCNPGKLGYPMASIRDRAEKVHRLVAKAFIPNPDNKPFVNHKNGIKNDNRVENLEWVTFAENIQHAYDIGLLVRVGKKGVESNLTKLSPKEVIEIRKIWVSGSRPRQIDIANMFGISRRNVAMIVQRKTWDHIK